MFSRNLIALSLAAFCANLMADVSLPAIISDNMVLQAGADVRIWGRAAPGETVEVSFAGQSAQSVADKSGAWSVTLKPLAASSDAKTLVVTGKNKIEVKNVLVGEVWLGSGQSNMELSVFGAANAKQEIAEANFPGIRLFHVPCEISSSPASDCKGKWQVCSPSSIGRFPAALYFFGRALHKQLKVPVGLVGSAVGATTLQAWLPADVMAANPAFGKLPDIPADKYVDLKTYAQYKNDIYAPLLYNDAGNKGEAEGWQKATCATADWKTVTLFQPLEKALGLDMDGAIWLRREIKLPQDWAGKDFLLNFDLPGGNAMDIYFNGEKVGSTKNSFDHWWTGIKIPGGLVKEGGNLLAIRCLNLFGPAGANNIEASNDKAKITMTGDWLCKVEQSRPEVKAPSLPAPRQLNSAFHNGMIAPLKNFTFKGVLWYQGESNVFQAELYETLLKSLITSWRAEFENPALHFLTVQLPNYGTPCTQAGETSAWAVLRESQSKALSLPNTGMAVTIDLGEERDIHPKNKQDVGRRLALVARNLCYGEKDLESSGPVFASLSAEGSALRVKFSHATGGLVAKDGPLKGFAVAGADGKFVWADARIDGDSVIISKAAIAKPAMVRYDWASAPCGNLYNGVGLPAAPFRTQR